MLLVPFDNSELSRTALKRAEAFGQSQAENVLALIVIPPDEIFARDRGWIEEHEPYDPERIADSFEKSVTEIASTVATQIERPEETSSLASTELDISRTIRQVAHDTEASIVFIGSENAGRVTSSLTSVGTPVAKDPDYDVYIVRHTS